MADLCENSTPSSNSSSSSISSTSKSTVQSTVQSAVQSTVNYLTADRCNPVSNIVVDDSTPIKTNNLLFSSSESNSTKSDHSLTSTSLSQLTTGQTNACNNLMMNNLNSSMIESMKTSSMIESMKTSSTNSSLNNSSTSTPEHSSNDSSDEDNLDEERSLFNQHCDSDKESIDTQHSSRMDKQRKCRIFGSSSSFVCNNVCGFCCCWFIF